MNIFCPFFTAFIVGFEKVNVSCQILPGINDTVVDVTLLCKVSLCCIAQWYIPVCCSFALWMSKVLLVVVDILPVSKLTTTFYHNLLETLFFGEAETLFYIVEMVILVK